MAINKVVYGNQTLIDLTTDTVASSDDILAGKVGHLRDGSVVTGTASGGDQHGTIWQDGQGYVHLDDESGIALQSKTATPTESQQVIEADEGYYALDKVTVKAVASGTAGTPTATKGTVSNHAVTVTPSVTNTTGYISGGTKTGTAVTISASELVSGSETKTANGTYDVTNLQTLVVNVSGGGSSGMVKGTLTLDSDVVTSVDTIITTTTEIGFVPTKFLFVRNDATLNSGFLYFASFVNIADTLYLRIRAIYNAQNESLVATPAYTSWTTSASGHLRLLNGNIAIRTSSSYPLKAGTYTWIAIE